MARRLLRFLLTTSVLLAAGLLVRRTLHLRDEATDVTPSPDPWTPITESRPESRPEPEPEPEPTEPAVRTEAAPAWRSPVDGQCPPTHLIKAKAASGIYHLPGMLNYERTKPDRCYAEASAAEADGFTKAKR